MLARTRLLLRVSSPAHAMRLSGGGAAAAVVGGQSVANELRVRGVGVESWGGGHGVERVSKRARTSTSTSPLAATSDKDGNVLASPTSACAPASLASVSPGAVCVVHVPTVNSGGEKTSTRTGEAASGDTRVHARPANASQTPSDGAAAMRGSSPPSASAVVLAWHDDMPRDDAERVVAAVVERLKRGEVVGLPTDTIYGIGCMVQNTSAVNR
jgi:hypothetical protein